jgi:hypothetical protein
MQAKFPGVVAAGTAAMITSEECRRHSAYCREEAKFEDDLGARTALLALSRSWATIADQIDGFEAVLRPGIFTTRNTSHPRDLSLA